MVVHNQIILKYLKALIYDSKSSFIFTTLLVYRQGVNVPAFIVYF